MRFTLSAALALALCLPALAQPGRGGFGGPGGGNPFNPRGGEQPSKEIEDLKATIKALEAKLKAAGEGKKVEVVVIEKKDEKKDEKKEEKKPEVKKSEGDRKPEVKKEEKPEPKKEEKKEEKREEKRPADPKPPEGPRGFGGFGGPGLPPMGGGFGAMRGGQPGTPPGFDKLNNDEQAMFRKLMEKMMGGEPGGRRPEGGDRKPNVEERLERLERAIDEIRRGMQQPRGGR